MAPSNPATTTGAPRLMDSDLAREPSFLVARTRSLGSALANGRLAALDLRVRSYSVLSLACAEPAPTQRELADFLSLDPSQIVALVDALERRGLVGRESDPSDRRSKLVSATLEGRAVYREARKATAAAEDEALAGLDASEREVLLRLLAKAAFGGVPQST
ncbi:MarR family winged helix-turn-helix transcriptional regulator [Arthrobacter sp. KK5.5]|uniref:MarR family winged helix-turn-helix transcriptional regulator n=1 Tax=Arthrobacter sp. KK5.5 TaxID=3373084 RepID=UPI003EE49200